MALIDELKTQRAEAEAALATQEEFVRAHLINVDDWCVRIADLDKAISALSPPESKEQSQREGVEIPEGFTKWEGGECPVEDETIVEVIYSNGHRKVGPAWGRDWEPAEDGIVVAAYRIIEPPAQPDTSTEGDVVAQQATLDSDFRLGRSRHFHGFERPADDFYFDPDRSKALDASPDPQPSPDSEPENHTFKAPDGVWNVTTRVTDLEGNLAETTETVVAPWPREPAQSEAQQQAEMALQEEGVELNDHFFPEGGISEVLSNGVSTLAKKPVGVA